jgi:hypothetical protein
VREEDVPMWKEILVSVETKESLPLSLESFVVYDLIKLLSSCRNGKEIDAEAPLGVRV